MLKRSVIFVCLALAATSFQVSERVLQKAEKVMSKFYAADDIDLSPITIDDASNKATPSHFDAWNFFKIMKQNKHIGYGYIGNAPSKTATFDYLVLFDTDFIVTKSSVLIYREEYGGEIGSKRWLKQFDGAGSNSKEMIYGQDIIPISGATISVQSMTKAMNSLLQSIAVLKELKAI